MAEFRNVLAHKYIGIDWNEVYQNLQRSSDPNQFAEFLKTWMGKKQVSKK
jgi:uncharacterized protein YutE (UPF0331/DUF86 family)